VVCEQEPNEYEIFEFLECAKREFRRFFGEEREEEIKNFFSIN
jgi:hypothetical protein